MSDEEEINQLAYEVEKWLNEKIHSQKSMAVANAILPMYHENKENCSFKLKIASRQRRP